MSSLKCTERITSAMVVKPSSILLNPADRSVVMPSVMALPQRLRGSITDQEPLDGVAHPQHLEHPDPPIEPGMRAEGAAGAPLEEHPVAADLAVKLALLWWRLVGCGALGT